jgi:hypothetical protein
MSRTSSGSGPIAPYAPGNENCSYNVLFDENSTSHTSHPFIVDNNFVRVAAFNLSPGEQVIIEQVTGLGAGDLVADYAPVSGRVILYYNSPTDQKTSHILERAGRYRALLSSGVGSVHVYAIQYFIENEASQDVADALYAIIAQLTAITPCSFGAKIPRNHVAVNNVVGLDNTNCLVDFTLVSGHAGNVITLLPDGVYSAGSSSPDNCTLGAAVPAAVTAPDNYVGKDGDGCLVDSQLLSSDSGNLLQLRSDGVFYGITPPPNFTDQYVSSSTGNDSNAGTRLSPLRTIQKAVSNLPDGTMGNIWLLAGDTFHTYPTASGDTINTLTFAQTLTQLATLNVGNRILTFAPYNDSAIDTINAYNTANDTLYDPYVVQQINFPVIAVTISLPTDQSFGVALGFKTGPAGVLNFNGIKFSVGKLDSPNVINAAITGNGSFTIHGGSIVLSRVPFIGNLNGSGAMNFSAFLAQVHDNSVPSSPNPYFCVVGSQMFINTVAPVSAGTPLYPLAGTFTNNGDNYESYLVTAAFWEEVVIYSTAFRSFKKVITSIAIA